MDDSHLCHVCGAFYGEGRNCPECRSVRRKDAIIRFLIGAMFVVPMITLIVSLVIGGNGGHAVPD